MNTTMKYLFVLAACMSLLCGCHTARPTAAITAWEYMVVDARLFVPLNTAINKAGADGWECVAVGTYGDQTGYAIMKRPKR